MTNIAIERKRHKITQLGLSKMIGRSINYMSLVENRKLIVPVNIAVKIANIFGLKVEDFEEFNNQTNSRINMKIYLVSTNDKISYDEYDSIVVIAENIEDAAMVAKENCWNFKENLSISEIGIANDNQNRGEVLASYNAG